ncbi:MAG: hypothetical protein FWH14_07190 [Oscillospiraceae bacterium]|nr:hypothetical protein [Oscillospiraceae bacterium]
MANTRNFVAIVFDGVVFPCRRSGGCFSFRGFSVFRGFVSHAYPTGLKSHYLFIESTNS